MYPTDARAGRNSRLVLSLMFAGALVAASCTSSSGGSDGVNESGPTTAAPTSDPDVAESTPSTSAVTPPPATTAGNVGFATTKTVAPDPTGLPDLTAFDPDIVTGTLDNGLRYFVRENENPGSRVEMRLTINAGSALQDDDQGGGAHFLEHMLFNGTEQFPENELIAVLRSFGAGFGADINAYTSYDETVYELTMPVADPAVVSTGLDVLQQWLSAATIDPAQVVAERGVVLDEWRNSAQASNGRIFDEIQKFFLDGSPYENRKPIGEDDEISSTEDGPLRRFYDDWYRPDNASVIVVGDIDSGDIEQQIIERFSPATDRGTSPDREELVVDPRVDDRSIVVADSDLSEGFAYVSLPVAVDPAGARVEVVQRAVLDGLAFDMIATRLSNDALTGDAPFDDASVDSSGFVRLLDSPEIVVSADGADLEASTQAVLDEYERVRRFGFSQAEVDRAVAAQRSSAQIEYDGRFSRQDASYADEYIRHVLEGESLPSAQRWFDYITEVLDRVTPETVAYMFVERLERAGSHIFVAAPQDEIDDVPDADVFVAQAETVGERELDPREAVAAIGATLMDRPPAVKEIATDELAAGIEVSFIAPTMLTFENGVRVVLNNTPISDGGVLFEARSPGGTMAVDDEDVRPAEAAASVVEVSGVGDFDPVAIDAFLSDKEVQLDASIDIFTEGFFGFAATTDIETLFQLINLSMTNPRVDPIALEQYIDDELPLAEDPSINPGYASFKALTEARYDDPRYLLASVDDLNGLEVADVRRVFVDRFGDASDWVFSFNGDFDMAEVSDLARSYLGTLPATGRVEPTDYVEPPPPGGVLNETTRAGEGDQASIAFLFTGPGTTDRRDDVAARMVQEIVTARLTDTIREELGESYSPFAAVELTAGASPLTEMFVSISTGPDLVDNVSSAVLEQLADLRSNGPTDAEFEAAVETISNEFELFSNQQINDEVLRALTDPAGHASFDEFLTQDELVSTISQSDLRAFIQIWAPADQYISVTVLPR